MSNPSSHGFSDLLQARWEQSTFLCVGLDTRYERLPAPFTSVPSREAAVVAFNKAIIDATHDLVCAFKPNSAYYEALGAKGHTALAKTIRYIKDTYPVLDAKRGDIGETNAAYAHAVFDLLGADATTVHPYLGRASLAPFLERGDKGIIVMGANSNPGSGEFQDLSVGPQAEPLYAHVSRQVATTWNALGNCGLTVGSNDPAKIRHIREIVGDMPLLILGVGAQGGDVSAAVRTGVDRRGHGSLVNSSRAILYASPGHDFQDAARVAAQQLSDAIHAVIAR